MVSSIPIASPASPASVGLDQGLSHDQFNSAVTAITSAFGDSTRREIYLAARDNPNGFTAGEIAKKFSLHSNVARHHLEKLSSGGYLIVEIDDQRARSAGRPSKRYRVASIKGDELTIPIRHDDLLSHLLVRALDTLGAEQAENIADEIGFEYGQMLAERMEPSARQRSVQNAIASVAEALTALGFDAHADTKGNELAIVSECCPFGDTAQQYPHVVCALDRGMIRGMLAGLYGDTSPHFESSRPSGADRCVARI